MSALASLCSLLAVDKKPSMDEKIAIFSDSLNHASIIDGIHMIERQQVVRVFVYKHCDTVHLDNLMYVLYNDTFILFIYPLTMYCT